MGKNRPESGITRRLIILIVVFSSVITLVITAMQLFDEYRQGVDSVRQQIVQIEKLSLPSMTENLWNLYDQQVQAQLDDLARFPDVQLLEIFSQGNLIASSGIALESDIVDLLPIVYPRGEEQIVLGELRVHTTLAGVYQRLYDRALFVLVSNTTKTALVSLFMFFLFQMLVTRHLNKIAGYLQDYSLDQEQDKLALDRDAVGDEIDMVVEKINQLMTNLGETTISRDKLEGLVDERTRELSDAQEELVRKERLALLGQLTATVSHELRNPLGAIRSSLYTIGKRIGEDEKGQAAYTRIDRNIDQCDRIIDELLDFTRMSKLERRPVRIDEWLGQVIDEQPVAEWIQVVREFSLGELCAQVDPDRLRRAVINVFENARQAIEQAGESQITRTAPRLVIETRATANRLEIIVSDNGPGIPQQDLEKIFVVLYSTKGFGVGLGMPTVKQIMEQHDGDVEVNSEVGAGTSVTLWLPLDADDGDGPDSD